MIFGTSFLISLVALSENSVYILNPYHLKEIHSSQVSSDQWLASFYKRVPIVVNLERSQIKDSRGESLDEKMKQATQNYLELKHERALELADEALSLVSESLPYQGMKNDIMDILALRLMVIEGDKANALSAKDIPEEAQSFIQKQEFQSRLPTRLNYRVQQFPKAKKISTRLNDKSTDRIFVFGTEEKAPLMLEPGRYLVHILSGPELQANWLSLDQTGETKLNKIWSRSIWKTLSINQLRSSIMATRPTSLKPGDLSVALHDGSLLSIAKVTEARMPQTLAWPDLFDLKPKTQNESELLFKSPWFWLIAGLAVGTAGYFVYDATQTKTATSP